MIVGQITLLPPTSDPGPPAGPVHVLLPLAAGVWHRDTGTQSHWHGTHSVLARARGCSEFFLKGQWRLAGLDCPVPSLDTPTGGRCAHGAQFGPPITDLPFLGPSRVSSHSVRGPSGPAQSQAALAWSPLSGSCLGTQRAARHQTHKRTPDLGPCSLCGVRGLRKNSTCCFVPNFFRRRWTPAIPSSSPSRSPFTLQDYSAIWF